MLNATESLRQFLAAPGELQAGAERNDQGEQSEKPSAATPPKQLFERSAFSERWVISQNTHFPRFQGMQASLCSPMQHVRDIGARHGLAVYDSRNGAASASSPQSIAQWAAQRLGTSCQPHSTGITFFPQDLTLPRLKEDEKTTQCSSTWTANCPCTIKRT